MTTTADGLVALPDVALIPLIEIEPAYGRPRRRVYEPELEALTASIREFGLLQPIVVRRTARQRYELLAGERRLLAFQNLGHALIPAIITAGLPALDVSLVENLQRHDLDPLELAQALHRLAAKGHAREAIARIVGRSKTWVGDVMVIAGLPDRIKREFPSYRRYVSRSLLTEIARVNHEPAQLAMWELAKRGGLTVRAAREKRRAVAAEGPVTLPRAIAAARRVVGVFARLEPTEEPLAMADRDALLDLRRRIDALLGAG